MRGTVRRCLTGLVLTTLLPLYGSQPGSTPQLTPAAECHSVRSSLELGVQFKGIWSDYTDQQRVQVLDQLYDSGVRSVRIDISWALLQPDGPDQYSPWGVGLVDHVIDLVRSRGLDPMVTLWLAPTWARGGAGERAAPINPDDYGRAAQWSAEHWRGRVAAWEVWNEPNDSGFLQDASPAVYAGLLQSAYRGFKAGAPETPVVFGGTSYVDTDWISSVFAAGASQSFDVMAVHPYLGRADAPPETPDDGTRETLTHLDELHTLMMRAGNGDKPVWLTEFGWSSHDNTDIEHAWERGVSETVQAEYLRSSLQLLATRYPWVTRAYWYTDRNQATGNPHQDNFGLLTRDLKPKPVLDSVADFMLPNC